MSNQQRLEGLKAWMHFMEDSNPEAWKRAHTKKARFRMPRLIEEMDFGTRVTNLPVEDKDTGTTNND